MEHVGIFPHDVGLDFPQYYVKSLFCFAAEGRVNGWGIRILHAILYGCIPVVIMPFFGLTLIWEELLPWDRFAVVVSESELNELPERLLSYTPQEIREMRRELACALPRFLYSSLFGSYMGEELKADAIATLLKLVHAGLQLLQSFLVTIFRLKEKRDKKVRSD
eukprot:gene4677-5725_t